MAASIPFDDTLELLLLKSLAHVEVGFGQFEKHFVGDGRHSIERLVDPDITGSFWSK